jgi:hypothetical protein
MRVGPLGSFRIRKVNIFEQSGNSLCDFGPVEVCVYAEHFGDLVTNRPQWVQGSHRLLEDHADPRATDLSQLCIAQRQKIFTLKQDLADRCPDPFR